MDIELDGGGYVWLVDDGRRRVVGGEGGGCHSCLCFTTHRAQRGVPIEYGERAKTVERED